MSTSTDQSQHWHAVTPFAKTTLAYKVDPTKKHLQTPAALLVTLPSSLEVAIPFLFNVVCLISDLLQTHYNYIGQFPHKDPVKRNIDRWTWSNALSVTAEEFRSKENFGAPLLANHVNIPPHGLHSYLALFDGLDAHDNVLATLFLKRVVQQLYNTSKLHLHLDTSKHSLRSSSLLLNLCLFMAQVAALTDTYPTDLIIELTITPKQDELPLYKNIQAIDLQEDMEDNTDHFLAWKLHSTGEDIQHGKHVMSATGNTMLLLEDRLCFKVEEKKGE